MLLLRRPSPLWSYLHAFILRFPQPGGTQNSRPPYLRFMLRRNKQTRSYFWLFKGNSLGLHRLNKIGLAWLICPFLSQSLMEGGIWNAGVGQTSFMALSLELGWRSALLQLIGAWHSRQTTWFCKFCFYHLRAKFVFISIWVDTSLTWR